jgi:proliferating cell nuclear antigen
MSESRPQHEADELSDPAFHASVRAETIRTAVETVHALVTECRVHLAADGIHIAVTDPATVASVTLDLHSTAFDIYEGDAGVVGVNLDRLTEILSVADRDQSVAFALDAETRKLHVTTRYRFSGQSWLGY